MYDKSKKTWSQRLKIHKNEKSQATAGNSAATSITTTATNLQATATAAVVATKNPHNLEATINVAAHNVNSSKSRASMPQYQIAPIGIMHLPTLGDYHASGGAGNGYEYMPNHMNRSIKYAEPWIYGTVRGIPARPAGIYHPAYAHYAGHPHAATIFAAPTTDLATGAAAATAVAVVLCSCHEYLSGTKGRSLKKPSICKKCKGTRLPLHNIGGTVRLPTNLPSPKLRPVGAASTVRVVSSSKKMRPTILDPQKDPYDLMRRTRLLSPEPGTVSGGSAGSSSKDKARQRGKSASPVRGRSRTRHHKVLASTSNTKESSKSSENYDDNWLTESEDLALTASSSSAASSSRRSILRCNVNPYDLISINNQASGPSSTPLMESQSSSKEAAKKASRKQKLQFSQNEFMPPNDDFNVQDAALTEEEPPFMHRSSKVRVENSKPDNNKKLIEEPPPPQTPPQNKKPNYINVQAIAGQRISLGEEQQAPKSLLQQTADGTTTYESFAIESESSPTTSKEMEKSNKTRPDSLQVPLGEPKRPPRVVKQTSNCSETKEISNKENTEEEEELMVTVTVTPTYNIKSILKRPTSKTSESGDNTQTDSISKTHATPSTPTKQRENGNGSKSGTPTNTRRNQVTVNSPTANSQFYIPLPQARKKVQFMVEDGEQTGSEDQDDEDSFYDNSSSTSPASLASDLKTNYEYYSKKRNLKKLTNDNESQDNISEDSDEIITYDEQFIQAMLLEKLQLDSELVTKRFTSNQAQEENDDEAAITNIKTVYEDVVAINGEQNKSQYTRQQNELIEGENEENYDDKHYINENLGKAKTSLPLSTETLKGIEQTFQSSTLEAITATVLHPQTCSKVACETTSMEMSAYSNNNNAMNYKNNDIDDFECLPAKDNNENNEENLIIATVHQECKDNKDDDDDGNNNNVSTNSDSDGGPHKNVTPAAAIVDDADDDNDDQHLSDILLTAVDDDVYNGDGSCSYANKPPTCHRNHLSQDDDVDAVDNDNVNISTSLSPVSKVQHNGAKKSTTSDYDDDAKTKQHKQQKCTKKTKKDMQALAAVADSSSSNVSSSCNTTTNSTSGSSKNRKISTKETQSRNPIRRSQSERQPTTTAPTMRTTSTYHNSNNNSNNKKKKDQQLHHNTAHVDNGGSSGSNENIIPNTRNSLKDIENIPNNINDSKSADCAGLVTVRHSVASVRGGNGNKTSLHFHDTMALRNRYNRNDTRDLFSLGPIGRPREPPPPPPSSASSSMPQTSPPLQSTTTAVDMANSMATTTTSLSNSLPKAVDSKESTNSSSITLATDAVDSFLQQQQTVNGLEIRKQQQREQKLTITTANNTIFCKEINEVTLIEDKTIKLQQQQMVSTTKTSTEMTNIEKTTTDLSSQSTLSSPLDKSQEQQKILPAVNGNNKQQQRTVVRVAPFNKNSSEVHRLKISHTDNNDAYPHSPQTPRTPNTPNSTRNNFTCMPHSSPFSNSSHYSVTDLSTLNASNEYGQKKTSILINGDDCYSTMNLSCDDSCTPLYQSSVVVTDGSTKTDNDLQGLRVTNTYNTVTINVSSPRSSEDELIQHHNQLNNLLKRQAKTSSATGSIRAIIPIRGTIDINLQRSASSTSSTSTSSITSSCSSSSSTSNTGNTSKRGKTLIRLDYEKEKPLVNESKISSTMINEQLPEEEDTDEWLPHETELLKILRNPVEAVKRNLVPHICKLRETDTQKDAKRSKKMKERHSDILETSVTSSSSSSSNVVASTSNKATDSSSSTTFIGKLLEDPMLQQVAEGLETDTVAELIENSLKRLQESRSSLDMTGTKDNDDMNRLIDLSLKRIQEERNSSNKEANCNTNLLNVPSKDEERLSNRGSISSANSFASAHNYELFEFEANESDCYQSCSSDINSIMEDDIPSPETKTKFYQMLVDATLQEIELSTNIEDMTNDEHQYESIRHNIDPIYEEISDVPPPLPLTAPPLNDPELEKKSARSIFEGASKYDILSYLVDAKERGLVKEEPFDYPLNCSNPIIIEEESTDTLSDLGKLNKLKRIDTISSRSSIMSDSSDDNQSTMSSLSPPTSNNFMLLRNKQATSDIERNDSGVGSETSKSSRSKFLNPTISSSPSPTSNSSSPIPHQHSSQTRSSPIHLCEDCDGPVETQIGENGHIFAPLVCRKCGKKRVERKEIITEVVETEEKYGRDLQIILEEFCHPMLVAGLLTQEQLSAIFLNTEELLENNQTLAERMRDALDIALEQGDDDLLTVNIGKIFLESTQMLHAFESYCVRQAGASLLLANLEKEKELLRIFLKVSQMENAVLRRMNLNSFLMVPVQRVTKYPLLLARLYKVTPAHLEGRDQLKQAQEKIELHLNHINQEAKDVPTKLWRRISSSSPNRRASCEIDMINIKLRKMAIDVLEWNHDEVRFVMEGKLLYTQPTDSNWKKARTIKLTTVNALLVTNGKPSTNYKAEKVMSDKLNFPKHTGIREASLLVVKEKCGRYTLIREPLYLDRCVVCSEADWDEYFEIQEISSKDTFIFKAEDNVRTKQWYTQLQYHAQGMGAWRKRRNALANIMINGMLTRS
ncbi:hypothetical protein FF38_04816 [Lucilia cuprina]|uniref:Uncharacterized protein n=1 Tax=Lucilia cuprina TaxID=7375 RepID=A0A0L0BMZ7_LUCCU|nr:hypothetical protein FF38_04816 [Lucilia cuprina]